MIHEKLASDKDFMLKHTLLSIAKLHNLYGQVDNYMRQFAKACVDLPDGGDIAKKLERALNAPIAIIDPAKKSAFQPKKTLDGKTEDYQTAHPDILAQADF